MKRLNNKYVALHPMLEKLQRQIQEYNKDTEAKIDQVATRQNMITLAFVVFNITVFLVLESALRGKEALSANNIFSIVYGKMLYIYMKSFFSRHSL